MILPVRPAVVDKFHQEHPKLSSRVVYSKRPDLYCALPKKPYADRSIQGGGRVACNRNSQGELSLSIGMGKPEAFSGTSPLENAGGKGFRLTVLVPVYNERHVAEAAIRRVLNLSDH